MKSKPLMMSRPDTKRSLGKKVINPISFGNLSKENVEEFTINSRKSNLKEVSILNEQCFSISSSFRKGEINVSEESKSNKKGVKQPVNKPEYKNKSQENYLDGCVNYNINNSQYTLNFFMDKEGKFPNECIQFKGTIDNTDQLSDKIFSVLDTLNPGKDESDCFNLLRRISNIYDQICINSIRFKTETGKELEEE